MRLKFVSSFMMALLLFGSFAPFATAQSRGFANLASQGDYSGGYGSSVNTWQSSRPTFDSFYSGSRDTYWPILSKLEKDQCDSVTSDFVIAIPPGGCSPTVVRSDLLAEQNVPVFCQLSAIRVNPLIDVSTIKSISFKGDYPDEVAGISFHPARAAVRSYRTLIGSPVEENIGYVVIVLKKQPDERDLEKYVSGLLTARIRYDAVGAFGVGSAEYYLEPVGDDEWNRSAKGFSFWAGKGYVRATSIGENEATLEVLTDKNNVYRTVTLKEGETSNRIYYPGQYCTAALKLKLNKLDNSEDMARIDIEGDSYWVRKGSRLLNGKCSVRDLNVFPGAAGEIEIACSGEKTFKLELVNREVVLNNGTDVNVMIGGSIKKENNDYYLGYYGSFEEKDFVVIFDKSVTEDEVSEVTRIFDGRNFENEDEVRNVLKDKNIFSKAGESSVLFEDDERSGITFVSIEGKNSGKRYPKGDTGIQEYLKLGSDTAMGLIDNFGGERKENGDAWGEGVLYNQIIIAGKAGDTDMQKELIRAFLIEYPDSDSREYIRDLKLRIERHDFGTSSKNVFVNNDNYNIRVDGFVSGSGYGDSVDVRIHGRSAKSLMRGGVYDGNLEKINGSEGVSNSLTVKDIKGDGATFIYVWKDPGKDSSSSKSFNIKVGDYLTVGGVEFGITRTNVKEVAYVSLIPEVRNTKTEANFTFKIGIEKRAFDISPEAAQKKVDRLNESIREWDDRVEKLGKLVKGLKGACLAVSTVLTLKTMFSGFVNGEALARDEVMDFYRAKCRGVGEGAETSVELQQCYSKYNEDITTAIEDYGDSVVEVNKKVECAKTSDTVSSGFWETNVVDADEYVKKLATCSGIANDWEYRYANINITKGHLTDASDYRAVLLYEEACKKPESKACEIAKIKMEEALSDNIDSFNNNVRLAENLNEFGAEIPIGRYKAEDAITVYTIKAKGIEIVGDKDKNKNNNFLADVNDPDNPAKLYIVELNKNGDIVNIYDKGSKELIYGPDIGDGVETELSGRIAVNYNFIIPSGDSCSNPIISPYVQYYELANKRGFAKIVPFDLKDGWYAYVENKDYTDSGVANAFSICNVGNGGLIDGGSLGGKDNCVMMRSSVGSDVHFTPCIRKSKDEVSRMYEKADAAIREANRLGNGIRVDGEWVGATLPSGPTSSGLGCSNFMSVDDCNLMFNVCDPVICPSSRCDLGGKFPVSDVIASGILGSIALCLPNFGSPSEGGVAVPVCLSGIHAGLDSYVSILRSHRDCLVRNIETGEYTGICDEITGVYMCEFFWGQVSPILNVLAVKTVEGLYGGAQVRGGAEYLTIKKSFDSAEKSIDYLTSNYASNAFRAFETKNVEEIGGSVCKGFVGSSFPTSADAIDSFLDPESPTQFYATFKENLFSEATVPSTSHYKVYYHIYAGNDRGVQYRVYLKNPPESGYYSTRQTLLVDSGYGAKGVSVDESIDFTAPSGYKELCVTLNGQDECGFESVTSDFGLNYASQAYTASQVDDRQITSTEDCITTSASGWGLVNPNLQADVEKSLGQEDIANSGIVRVCASTNPEQGVVGGNDVYCKPSENGEGCLSEHSCEKISKEIKADVGVCVGKNGKRQVSGGRWTDVGHCDSTSMRCWLDSESVEANLELYAAVNGIENAEDLARDSERLKELEEQYKTVREKLSVQRTAIGGLEAKDLKLVNNLELLGKVKDIIAALDEVAGVGDNIGQGTNSNKAEALALKASVYGKIVETLIAANPEVRAVGARAVAPPEGVTGVVTGGEVGGGDSSPNIDTIFQHSHGGGPIFFKFDESSSKSWKFSTNKNNEWPGDWTSLNENMLGSVGLRDFPRGGFSSFEKGVKFFGGKEIETCCTADDGESSAVGGSESPAINIESYVNEKTFWNAYNEVDEENSPFSEFSFLEEEDLYEWEDGGEVLVVDEVDLPPEQSGYFKIKVKDNVIGTTHVYLITENSGFLKENFGHFPNVAGFFDEWEIKIPLSAGDEIVLNIDNNQEKFVESSGIAFKIKSRGKEYAVQNFVDDEVKLSFKEISEAV